MQSSNNRRFRVQTGGELVSVLTDQERVNEGKLKIIEKAVPMIAEEEMGGGVND